MNSQLTEAALLERRCIILKEPLYELQADRLISSIDYLEAIDPTLPIELRLDCDGGGYDSQMKLVDRMHNCEARIEGLVRGVAYSTGFNILQACAWRRAYPNAKLIYHMLSLAHTRPDQEAYRIAWDNSWRLHKIMVREHSKRCNQPPEMWHKWSAENHTFSAYEALELGIIDEVVNKSNYSWNEHSEEVNEVIANNVVQLTATN